MPQDTSCQTPCKRTERLQRRFIETSYRLRLLGQIAHSVGREANPLVPPLATVKQTLDFFTAGEQKGARRGRRRGRPTGWRTENAPIVASIAVLS